jgi:Kef-type K+ transport system membrane component KefB
LEEALRGKSFSGFFLVPWDYAAIVGLSPEEKAQGVVFLLFFIGLPFFFERGWIVLMRCGPPGVMRGSGDS